MKGQETLKGLLLVAALIVLSYLVVGMMNLPWREPGPLPTPPAIGDGSPAHPFQLQPASTRETGYGPGIYTIKSADCVTRTFVGHPVMNWTFTQVYAWPDSCMCASDVRTLTYERDGCTLAAN